MEKSNLYIGIDPGLGGAVAAIDERGQVIGLRDTPTLEVKKSGGGKKRVYVEGEMVSILRNLIKGRNHVEVIIENVHAMPKQGVSSMFSMGVGFGLWLGILSTLELDYERVEPKQWKKSMKIPTGSDKNKSIILARKKFPKADLHLKKHDGRAEALLLAEYIRRLSI